MKIALVYPSFYNPNNQPNIKAVAENYGVFPPLSLAQAAGVMQKAGHKVIIIDGNADNLSGGSIANKIKSFKPDLIGFTVTTYLFHQTLSYIEYIKERIDVPVLVGGVHLSIYPAETLSHNSIDYGFIGESNKSLVQLLEFIEKGKDIGKCQSVAYRRKDGKVVVKKSIYTDKNLDELPFPARNLLDNTKYYSFISQRKNFTAMVTSRGCPFKCIFCEQGGKKYSERSPESVVSEFEECYDKYGVREVDVFDPSFTIDRKRTIEIAKGIIKRGIDVDWVIRTRADLVDREMLHYLRRAGCKRIYYGIESGDSRILSNICKKTNLDLIRKNISLTKKEGIDTFGYFMIGNMGETKETVNKTIRFAKSLKLDFAQFAKVSTLPNTPLYSMLMKQIGFDYWREFTKNPQIDFQLPRFGTRLSEEEIDNLTKKAYISFYLRPDYILKRIIELKSFHELKRYVKAAIQIITP